MEKVIILTMQNSKDIIISIDGIEVFTITHDNRSVTAEALYNLFSYSRGDKYRVEFVNENNLDSPVLSFFFSLVNDIAERLNRLGDEVDLEEVDATNAASEQEFFEDTSADAEEDDDELPF